MFEQQIYTVLFYAFLIVLAYKALKWHDDLSLLPSKMLFDVWINRCIYYTTIYHGKVLFLMFN